MNRGVDGDTVAIQLFEKDNWAAPLEVRVSILRTSMILSHRRNRKSTKIPGEFCLVTCITTSTFSTKNLCLAIREY